MASAENNAALSKKTTVDPVDAALTGALTPRPDRARFFEAKYLLRTDTVDQDMRLRLDGIARFLQDIANENIAATEFADTDPYWIIRRTVVDVVEPITWPGTVTLQRWCAALSTRWTNMRVSITADHETNRFNPDPRPPGRVESEAFWINVNEQGMPSRLTDRALEFLGSGTDEHRLRWRSMNTEPAPDASASDRTHQLRITDFDPFKHVNNAASWEAIEDELVEHHDLVEGRFRAVIEYLRPIAYGATDHRITIRRRRVGDQLRVWMIIDEDGTEQVASTVTITRLPSDYYVD